MRQRPSSLFMHRFYQTPAVASVWIDALVDQRALVLGFLGGHEGADLRGALHDAQMARQALRLALQAGDLVRPDARGTAPAALAGPGGQRTEYEADDQRAEQIDHQRSFNEKRALWA